MKIVSHSSARLFVGRARLTGASAPGVELTVRITPTHIFVNCPRYIHRYRKVEASNSIPRAGEPPPVAAWKRIDYLQAVLPEEDRRRVAGVGTISQEQYECLVAAGDT